MSNLSKNWFEGEAENLWRKCQPLFSLIRQHGGGGRGGKTRLFDLGSSLVYFGKCSLSTKQYAKDPSRHWGNQGDQEWSPSWGTSGHGGLSMLYLIEPGPSREHCGGKGCVWERESGRSNEARVNHRWIIFWEPLLPQLTLKEDNFPAHTHTKSWDTAAPARSRWPPHFVQKVSTLSWRRERSMLC